MPALGALTPSLKGASAEEAVPFPGRHPELWAKVGDGVKG
jgi:hypothetical protein